MIRRNFPGVLILNGDYSGAEAAETVASGAADAVSFGRLYISNPDLVERLRHGYPLAAPLPAPTWNSQDDEGYADYPRYAPATV
jgi:2,4-dienoyl-CoA reductase-like NADH-dependent reductase (Old Yellow Enzyme family)